MSEPFDRERMRQRVMINKGPTPSEPEATPLHRSAADGDGLVGFPVAVMGQAAFDALPEYSTSLPTGQAIGKRWKKHIRTGPSTGRWILGEYAKASDPRNILIIWSWIKIVEPDHLHTSKLLDDKQRMAYGVEAVKSVDPADLNDGDLLLPAHPGDPVKIWQDNRWVVRAPTLSKSKPAVRPESKGPE